MRGINPLYLAKLDEDQRKFVLTGPGKRFFDDFITQHGYHAYVIGNTGSGKSQKFYWLVSYLVHTENIIWISTGKNDEILPLLTLGKPVRIICPKGCDVKLQVRNRETGKYEPIPDHPEVIPVSEASTAWYGVKKGYINIFEFRNCFWSKAKLSQWMGDLFESLATWTRLRMMPRIFPCAIFADESQWILAGTRISTDSHRVKTSEIVTENALEIRGAGGRLVFAAQDFKNITPASRENMLCTILCRGAMIDSGDNPRLHEHCVGRQGKRPSSFKPKHGKVVYADGESSPSFLPWSFPLFPKREADREWISRVRVVNEGYHDQQSKEAEYEEECFPQLGRFQALAIKPEVQEMVESRWSAPQCGGVEDD